MLLLLAFSLVENIVPQTLVSPVYGAVTYYPSTGDDWTENNNSTTPWYYSPSYKDTLTFQTAEKQVGNYALQINHTSATPVLAIYLNLTTLKNVSGYDTLAMWLKFVSPVSGRSIQFNIGETAAWSGTLFKYGVIPILNNTWQQWFCL